MLNYDARLRRMKNAKSWAYDEEGPGPAGLSPPPVENYIGAGRRSCEKRASVRGRYQSKSWQAL